ncbi:pilus assembly protein [Saxibacter everestensis]|uniref:Pilus assembly protein n=1 Tax=Saxibacter everestensis TaxID=2909229 RepID=A0ABY8QPK4_9MICO|nr:pilus assembly protein [Brevibacteriaceae bacterium ZFBP1038]
MARRADTGSAVADFALISGLLVLVFLGVIQLALILHVRNTVIDCAAEGARFAALGDQSATDGATRTKELISSSLSPKYARDVRAREITVDGVRLIEVSVSAPFPAVGLLGPGGALQLSGHSIAELP